METRLRRATGPDEQFYYLVRTEPGVVAASLAPPPTRREHAEWYALQGAIPRPGHGRPETWFLYVVEARPEPVARWEAVGTARLRPTLSRPAADGTARITAWISLAFLPAARGHGHGGRTLTLLYREARAIGAHDLSAWILPTNTASLRCFQRAGYQTIGQEGVLLATRVIEPDVVLTL